MVTMERVFSILVLLQLDIVSLAQSSGIASRAGSYKLIIFSVGASPAGDGAPEDKIKWKND